MGPLPKLDASMEPAFVVDGMLGSLARKLRMIGFDTAYYNDAGDDSLIKIASDEKRMLLTADRALFQKTIKLGLQGALLDAANDVEDLVHLFRNLGITDIGLAQEKSRCSLCNNELEERDRESIRSYVPAGVLEKHSRFYFCDRCGKAYWEGSHFGKMRELERIVNGRLRNAT